ncbi:long-chain-fatty-acid--CoA ligase [Bradyrhizobium sp. PRIMUS42]|uniref:long-chain-fatty-acid--CoA ligase n=1 Tax=Bradyrhizobium sp. PRIMUS42 TaxID=2908926 RepID=UPI001FF16F32|nr:long-chain-fatty-acid--CoA ligase [Bradyrhizobium sp. PRIMUS42]MCJ9729020.1 long-chain-fatty-acid--CoA ligase [Bradyrhizobium sp. PRIMUS42]
MQRFWLENYPDGVPADINVDQFPSLIEMFEASFAKFGDRKAAICMDKAITYRELDEMSGAIGAYLQSKGLAKGSRVAVMMPNVLQNPIAGAAALRAGCTVVNVNPLYTPRELEHQLIDSGAEAIFILENFASTLEKVLPRTNVKHIVICSIGELLGPKGILVNLVVRKVKKMVPAYALPSAVSFKNALSAGRKMKLRRPDIGPDDVAFLQYTGGTTGVSKGATLLHRNLVANVLQIYAWSEPAFRSVPAGEPLLTVCALPLYHIFALTVCFLFSVRIGGANLLIVNPRDIDGFVKELRKYKIHSFPAVNTLFNGLLRHPDFKNVDFSQLRMAIGGGMAIQKAVADKWLAVTGCVLSEGYGLSETSPTLTATLPTMTEFSGTIGLPLPSTYISIRDDDGNEAPIGEAGEICGKGPQVMPGYWNRPDETARVMTADGFFRTGDIGVMSADGFTKIVDRKKDMIIVSGFNVYPNEVEAVISSHPGVLECAAIGVPDAKSTEAVKVFVVRADPQLTAEELVSFAGTQLTPYKVPKLIEFRSELPKSNVGKILRRELRSGAQVGGGPQAS